MNYFKLFNIPETADIDLDKLDEQYFSIQKKYNLNQPDLQEADRARLFSALTQLNFGYKVLKSDVGRIEHLLSLKGINLDNYKDQIGIEILKSVVESDEKISTCTEFSALESMLLKYELSFNEKLKYIRSNFSISKDIVVALIELKYLDKIISNIKAKLL